jgi:hypothetical protein
MMRSSHPRSRSLATVFAGAVSLLVTVSACHKSSEQQAEEATKAAAVKSETEKKAFDELERGDPGRAGKLMVEGQNADERAARESADVPVAVARERDRFRALLTKEISWIDRRVADMERVALSADGNERLEKERDVAAAREWRERLAQDLAALDHPSPGTDWSALKQRIEHDLDENRPPSILHSYEKSYGI